MKRIREKSEGEKREGSKIEQEKGQGSKESGKEAINSLFLTLFSIQ